MIRVSLTWREIDAAAQVGVRQVVRAMSRGMRHRDGFTAVERPIWDAQITGFIAECAVAKAFGIPFEPDLTNFTRRPDVGEWEVRATRHLDGRLAVWPKDADDRRFLLVVVHEPTCDLIGWAYGDEAKRLGSWRRYGDSGCWYLDRHNLNHLDAVPA